MDKERFDQLLSQAFAYEAISDPRGQIESTLRQAINEAIESCAVKAENHGEGVREFYGVRQEIAYAIRDLKI